MKIIQRTKNFELNNTAVTLGKFDGMHKGHMSLVNEVADQGRQGLVPVLFTFDTSPYKAISGKKIGYILEENEKYNICRDSGIKVVIEYPFDKDTMLMEAEEFINEVLIKRLDARKIVVGRDFRFGKGRKGDVSMLLELMPENAEVIIKDKILYGNTEISSTYIRECIQAGRIDEANNMLGRAYSINGNVIYGKKLGRTIGVPTINLCIDDEKILPPFGVYASITEIDGKEYMGITNIGNNPTVSNDNSIKVETHLMKCNKELYGMYAKVRLYKFIRGEKKFSGIEELKCNIQKDIKSVDNFFNHGLDTI